MYEYVVVHEFYVRLFMLISCLGCWKQYYLKGRERERREKSVRAEGYYCTAP